MNFPSVWKERRVLAMEIVCPAKAREFFLANRVSGFGILKLNATEKERRGAGKMIC